jgi:hypothetical protein
MSLLLASVFPKELLLTLFQEQNVYCCQKSIENGTGVTKTKYKLASSCFSEVYMFFVVNSNNYGDRYVTLEVEKQDWENRDSGHLNNNISYINAGKIEALNEKELIEGLRNNSIYKVARLCDSKFIHLHELCKRARIKTSVSGSKKMLLSVASGEEIKEIDKKEIEVFFDKYKKI